MMKIAIRINQLIIPIKALNDVIKINELKWLVCRSQERILHKTQR